jgi:hypothetical protein
LIEHLHSDIKMPYRKFTYLKKLKMKQHLTFLKLSSGSVKTSHLCARIIKTPSCDLLISYDYPFKLVSVSRLRNSGIRKLDVAQTKL